MKLSVIIPAFNRERTVGATIESVLACGAPAEVVVVDDESSDRTSEVARGFGPSVTVVRQPNAGPAGARNTGLRHATGEVIAFLDSDDVWSPGVVPEALAFLARYPEIDVLACEALVGTAVDGYVPLTPINGRGRFASLLTDPVEPGFYRLPRAGLVSLMIERMQVFLGSTLICRGALADVPFDPGLFGGEDYELCLRLSAARRFAFWERPLARYEKHPGGLSANPDRMAREFALALRSLVRKPDTLTADERRAVRARYAEMAFGYAYRAYDAGDYAEARRRFGAALRDGGPRPRTLAYWAACLLPAPLVRAARRAKQARPATPTEGRPTP